MKHRTGRSSARIQHSKRRAQERYGFVPTKKEILTIAGDIRRNKIQTIKQTSSRSYFQTTLRGLEIFGIYDRKAHEVVTFLTKEQFYDQGASATAESG